MIFQFRKCEKMKAKNALNTLDLSMSVFVRWPPSSCNGPMLFLRCLLSLTCLKKTSFYCSHYSVHFQPHLSFGCTIFFPYNNEQHFCTLPVSPDLASTGHTPSFCLLISKRSILSQVAFCITCLASIIVFGSSKFIIFDLLLLAIGKHTYILSVA